MAQTKAWDSSVNSGETEFFAVGNDVSEYTIINLGAYPVAVHWVPWGGAEADPIDDATVIAGGTIAAGETAVITGIKNARVFYFIGSGGDTNGYIIA